MAPAQRIKLNARERKALRGLDQETIDFYIQIRLAAAQQAAQARCAQLQAKRP